MKNIVLNFFFFFHAFLKIYILLDLAVAQVVLVGFNLFKGEKERNFGEVDPLWLQSPEQGEHCYLLPPDLSVSHLQSSYQIQSKPFTKQRDGISCLLSPQVLTWRAGTLPPTVQQGPDSPSVNPYGSHCWSGKLSPSLTTSLILLRSPGHSVLPLVPTACSGAGPAGLEK